MEEKTAKPARTLGEKIFIAILLFFIVATGWAIFQPLVNRSPLNARRVACQSNLKLIMLGIQIYAQDYDERFPVVATSRSAFSAFGWADAVQSSYTGHAERYQCPSESNGPQFSTDPTQPQYTDYWFNARLSRLPNRGLSDPSKTIALGEGNDGSDVTDARYHLMSIPQKWRNNEKSPLYRHYSLANFAFADGHAKSIRGGSWENELDVNDKWTLRLNPKK